MITWERLTELEPRLLRLYQRALAYRQNGQPFDAFDIWYGCERMGDEFDELVGWSRKKDSAELGTSEAYDMAFDKILYETLLGEDMT